MILHSNIRRQHLQVHIYAANIYTVECLHSYNLSGANLQNIIRADQYKLDENYIKKSDAYSKLLHHKCYINKYS